MEQQIADFWKNCLEKTEDLLNTIRDKNITVSSLWGQNGLPYLIRQRLIGTSIEKKVFYDPKIPDPRMDLFYQGGP